MAYRRSGLGDFYTLNPQQQGCSATLLNQGKLLVDGYQGPTVPWVYNGMDVIGPIDAPLGPLQMDANGHPVTTGNVYPINLDGNCNPVADQSQPTPNPMAPIAAANQHQLQTQFNNELTALANAPISSQVLAQQSSSAPVVVNSSGADTGSTIFAIPGGSSITDFVTGSALDGIPNWLLIAGGLGLLLLMGGSHGR